MMEDEELTKVAFICVHNSCRSQIAEALGKHLASVKPCPLSLLLFRLVTVQ